MTHRLHICILTTAHPLDDVRVDRKIGKTLVNEGFEITWVGPNYSFFQHAPDSRYKLCTYRPGRGRVGRLVNIIKAIRYLNTVKKIDVLYAPDPDAAFVATIYAKRHGVKTIFDIHEIYHKVMLNRWVGTQGSRILGRIIRRGIGEVCRKSDLVIGVSEAVLNPYYGFLKDPLVVRNCPSKSFAPEKKAEILPDTRKYVTIMHGKNTPDRGTDIVLETAKILRNRRLEFRFVMFDIDPKKPSAGKVFRERVKALGIDGTIDLRPGISYDAMPSVLRRCDGGMIVYGRALGEDSLPNRLFEYMASGLPIIAPSYSKEIVEILKEENCGIAVDAEKPEELARAIEILATDRDETREQGRRAREGFFARHNWEIEIEPLLQRLRSFYL